MPALVCKSCGALLSLPSEHSTVKCDHCGLVQTYPKFDDDERIERYNNADFERRNYNFDNALNQFNEMAVRSGGEAELYWQKMLCRYGVSLVHDPKTGRDIPTLNRMQVNPVHDDQDYQKALEFSEGTPDHAYYLDMAEEIEEIRSKFMRVANREEPYDVFICFKENDDDQIRTVDSAQAQELYNYLSKENYKVFFSRVTLKKMAGQEFEPYIFAALKSSKVMFVFGSRKEFFTSSWVKNEWIRFLNYKKDDMDRLLIPVTKAGGEALLPEELKGYQYISFEEPGWFQDAKSNVERCVGSRIERQSAGSGTADRLFANAETQLTTLGNEAKARELYEKMTEEYPHDDRGWWGLLRIDSGDFKDPSRFKANENALLRYYDNVFKTADNEKIHKKTRDDIMGYLDLVADLKTNSDVNECPSIIDDWLPRKLSQLEEGKTEKQRVRSIINQEKQIYAKGSIVQVDDAIPKDVAFKINAVNKRRSDLDSRLQRIDTNAEKAINRIQKDTEAKKASINDEIKSSRKLGWVIPIFALALALFSGVAEAERSVGSISPLFLPLAKLYSVIGLIFLIAFAIAVGLLIWIWTGSGVGGVIGGIVAIVVGSLLLNMPTSNPRAVLNVEWLLLLIASAAIIIGVLMVIRGVSKRASLRRELMETLINEEEMLRQAEEDKQAQIESANEEWRTTLKERVQEIDAQDAKLASEIERDDRLRSSWGDWRMLVSRYLDEPDKIKDYHYQKLCGEFGIQVERDEEFCNLADEVWRNMPAR